MNRSLAEGALKSFDFTRSEVRDVSDLFSFLLNHLVRPSQHVGRNRQAELLGRFKVDN
jgi:hypothetical protein